MTKNGLMLAYFYEGVVRLREVVPIILKQDGNLIEYWPFGKRLALCLYAF